MRIPLGRHHHRDRQKVQDRNRFVQGMSLVHHGTWGANANESMSGVVRKRGHGRLGGERGNEIGRVNGDDGREESGCANEIGIDDEEKELEEEGEGVPKSIAVRQ